LLKTKKNTKNKTYMFYFSTNLKIIDLEQ